MEWAAHYAQVFNGIGDHKCSLPKQGLNCEDASRHWRVADTESMQLLSCRPSRENLWLDYTRECPSPAQELFVENMLAQEVAPPLGEVGLAKPSLMRPGSAGSGVFTLVASAMGAGCLSLPHMVQQSGLVLGLALLVLGAALAHVSLVVLMSCARYTGCGSFAELVALAHTGQADARERGRAGSTSQMAVDVVIAFYGLAAVLIYMMLVGDFVGGIVEAPCFPAQWANVSRAGLILGSLVIILPLSLPRQVSALRHVCFLSTSAILFMAVAVTWRVQHRESLRTEFAGELRLVAGDAVTTLKSFAIAIFAFAAHTNAVPSVTDLKDARSSHIWRVSLTSVLLELAVYAIIATSGYLTFLAATKQDFVRNYPANDSLIFFVRCVYSVPVLFGVPINLSPAVASLQSLVRRAVLTGGSMGTGSVPMWVRNADLLHGIMVSASLGLCAAMAIWSESVADVIGLLGSLFGTLICLWWPRQIYNRVLYEMHPPALAKTINGMLTLAVAFGCIAFLIQAWELVFGDL